MPCYNYSSNDPIYYSPNAGEWAVEKVFNAGDTYSYAAIARMCEIPAADQLCVYTRAAEGDPETKLTLGIDYTVNTTLERINLTSPLASGELVIRRCTPNDKMLFQFTEGAKITAKQLNASLYQLLFLGQEKEWVGATNNHYYPLSTNIAAWNSGTAYVVGNYALQSNVVYQCISNHTNQTPPNATYWTPVNFVTNGFIIDGGATLSGPVTFNLSNVSNGYGLIWNGTEFEAGTISGFLYNLSDVDITTPADKSILVYNSLISKWEDKLPRCDITLQNIIFYDHTFTDSSHTGGLSYSNDPINDYPISPPDALLGIFRDASNNYVQTDIPTFYHALKKLIPNEVNPETFFNDVQTTLDNVAVLVSNPVKVQLFWNLARGVPSNNISDAATGDSLLNFKSAFWDSPSEFYNPLMITNIGLLAKHGVTNSGTYRNNPWYYYEGSTYYSKIAGKGVKAFYLAVPMCYTTALCNIPVMNGGSFFARGNITPSELTSPKSSTYRDEYLTGLRDMAFAGVKSGLTSISSSDEYDHQARFAKSYLLSADYNGWEDVSYKRLEDSGESPQSCLFKIPKQIIYYNKVAMVLKEQTVGATVDTGTNWPITEVDSSNATNSTYSGTVRFSGDGALTSTNANESTTSYTYMGSLYKSDGFWGNWCSAWTVNTASFHFNEADIDWAVDGVTTGNTDQTLAMWDLSNNFFGRTPNISYTGGASNDDMNRLSMYPWPYRPNFWEKDDLNFDNHIGTHLLNMESNRLFSDATNFIPDPRDEYVFRLVVADSLYNTFKKAGSFNIASAIILEYGFEDHSHNGQTSFVSNTQENIYRRNKTTRQINRVRSRFAKDDVKVFILNEQLEKTSTEDEQYVVNICVSVPRLKSIGYARVFRKVHSNVGASTTVYAEPNLQDTDKDLGPWTFYIDTDAYVGNPNNSDNFGTYINDPGGIGTVSHYPKQVAVAGRNECAVKFTRMGIPGNLWLKVSILNTNGTTEFVQGSTIVFS